MQDVINFKTYLKAHGDIHEEYKKNQRTLSLRFDEIRRTAIDEFSEHNDNVIDTVPGFLDSMREKRRMIIIFENLQIIVLNDTTIPTAPPAFGLHMTEFKVEKGKVKFRSQDILGSEYEFTFLDHGQVYVGSLNRNNFLGGAATIYESQDSELIDICGYNVIQHIQIPAEFSLNSNRCD